MSDKKYKELSKRLDKSKKNGGNFRSYETIKKNANTDDAPKGNTNAHSPSQKALPPKKNKKKNSDFIALLATTVLPIVVVIAIIILGIFGLTRKNATEVTVNGEVVGQTKSKTTTEVFIKTLKAKIEKDEGTSVQIDDKIELKPVHGKKKLLAKDDSELLDKTASLIKDTYKIQAAEIKVNDVSVGIAKSQTEAQNIFNQVMAKYKPDNPEITGRFIEDVVANDIYVNREDIVDNDVIVAALEKTTTSSRVYVIESGDMLSTISAENGMTISEIKEANPELDVNKPLKIGDTLNITSVVPFVSVETTETKTEVVPLPRGVEEQSDPNLESGTKRIIKQGKDGKKEVTTKIVKVNGVLTDFSEEPTEKIVEKAETQIVANGTK